MSSADPIIVVGAGIVGVSTAIWLQRDGHKVTIIDRLPPGEGTSFGNGGVLASCAVVPVTGPGLITKAPKMVVDPESPLFLRWSYLPRLLPWLTRYLMNANKRDTKRIAEALSYVVPGSLEEHQQLAEGTGAEHWIAPSDYLYLYGDRAAFDGEAFSWGLRREAGITWDEFDRSAFSDYDPIFDESVGFAVKMGDHGHIRDPGQYVKDLAAHFVNEGGTLLQTSVEDVERHGDEITAVVTSDATLACSSFVLCGGVWSGPLAKKLGLAVPLETERGYHIELYGPNIMPRAPVMIASGKFVATPMEGRLRLAGIVEFGGLNAPPSEKPFEFLLRHTKRAIPNLTWEREERWMGHRPAPTDSIPVMGFAPGLKNAITGFGHHHIGLTAGPKTGRILADLIAGRRPNFDLAPFDPARFAAE